MRVARFGWLRAVVLFCPIPASACDRAPEQPDVHVTNEPAPAVDARCALPTEPTVLLDDNGSVLLSWEFLADPLLLSEALPNDSTFLAYRAAIVGDDADIRRPVADPPEPSTEAEAAVWRDEGFNNALVYDDGVGSIAPISCLDALLFAYQAHRRSPISQPTEFLASVLRRPPPDTLQLAVVFGAGLEMFPPRAVYGFDVVDRYLAEGWSYWYALHNHTPQRNGDRLALGVPAPSTSDVALSRGLGRERGLHAVRVTNGFYTFEGSMSDLEAFRSR